MVDLTRLEEALDEIGWPSEDDVPRVILTAGRAVLDGQDIRRCVRHQADAWEPGDYCHIGWPGDIDDCVLVKVRLVKLEDE